MHDRKLGNESTGINTISAFSIQPSSEFRRRACGKAGNWTTQARDADHSAEPPHNHIRRDLPAERPETEGRANKVEIGERRSFVSANWHFREAIVTGHRTMTKDLPGEKQGT